MKYTTIKLLTLLGILASTLSMSAQSESVPEELIALKLTEPAASLSSYTFTVFTKMRHQFALEAHSSMQLKREN